VPQPRPVRCELTSRLRGLRRADRQSAAPTSDFYRDIDLRLGALEGPAPTRWEKWNARVLGQFVLIVGTLAGLIILLPNRMFDPELRVFTLTIADAWRMALRMVVHARRSAPNTTAA
jgi:hypothetical protein